MTEQIGVIDQGEPIPLLNGTKAKEEKEEHVRELEKLSTLP